MKTKQLKYLTLICLLIMGCEANAQNCTETKWHEKDGKLFKFTTAVNGEIRCQILATYGSFRNCMAGDLDPSPLNIQIAQRTSDCITLIEGGVYCKTELVGKDDLRKSSLTKK